MLCPRSKIITIGAKDDDLEVPWSCITVCHRIIQIIPRIIECDKIRCSSNVITSQCNQHLSDDNNTNLIFKFHLIFLDDCDLIRRCTNTSSINVRPEQPDGKETKSAPPINCSRWFTWLFVVLVEGLSPSSVPDTRTNVTVAEG